MMRLRKKSTVILNDQMDGKNGEKKMKDFINDIRNQAAKIILIQKNKINRTINNIGSPILILNTKINI